MDAYTYFCNKQDEKNCQVEIAYENFMENIADELQEIEEMINNLKSIARDYQNYDFTDELKDELRDMIC